MSVLPCHAARWPSNRFYRVHTPMALAQDTELIGVAAACAARREPGRRQYGRGHSFPGTSDMTESRPSDVTWTHSIDALHAVGIAVGMTRVGVHRDELSLRPAVDFHRDSERGGAWRRPPHVPRTPPPLAAPEWPTSGAAIRLVRQVAADRGRPCTAYERLARLSPSHREALWGWPSFYRASSQVDGNERASPTSSTARGPGECGSCSRLLTLARSQLQSPELEARARRRPPGGESREPRAHKPEPAPARPARGHGGRMRGGRLNR